MSEAHKPDELQGPLARAVTTALERYFAQLDGERPGDLYGFVMGHVERPLLKFVMQQADRNQCEAAKILGINRNTLRKKLRLHGLT